MCVICNVFVGVVVVVAVFRANLYIHSGDVHTATTNENKNALCTWEFISTMAFYTRTIAEVIIYLCIFFLSLFLTRLCCFFHHRHHHPALHFHSCEIEFGMCAHTLWRVRCDFFHSILLLLLLLLLVFFSLALLYLFRGCLHLHSAVKWENC